MPVIGITVCGLVAYNEAWLFDTPAARKQTGRYIKSKSLAILLKRSLSFYIFTKCRIVVSSIIDIRHVSVVVVTFGFRRWEALGVSIVSRSISVHCISVADDSPRCNPLTAVIPLLWFRRITQRRRRSDVNLQVGIVVGRLIRLFRRSVTFVSLWKIKRNQSIWFFIQQWL